MISISLLEAPYRRCQNLHFSNTNPFRKTFRKSLLGLVLFAFSFSSHSQSISIGSPVDGTEGSTFVSYIVSLDNGVTNGTGAPITGSVTYTGTATPGVDYNNVSSFSIPNGGTSAFVILPVIDDALVECTETVIATISNPNVGVVNPAAASSAASIIDDECPTSFVVSIGSPVDVTEGAGSPVSFLISLDNGAVNNTGADITGTLTYTGTATAGADYMGTGVVNFAIPNGSNSIGILVPIIDDAIIEPTETIIGTISNLNVGSVGNASSTANIYDDDSGLIQIAIGSPVDATESPVGSDITFDVSIVSGGVSAAPITGTLSYAGSATGGGVDYSGALSFLIPAGSLSTTLVLPVIDDFLTEPTESVIANLVGVPSIGLYANTTSTAYIYDDDASNLTMSIGSPIDGQEAGNDVSFVVSLDFGTTNGTGSDIYGSISYSGTASAADVANAPVLFTIPNGETSDTIVLTVIDDFLIECDETVIATISTPNVGTISTANATALIIDDECSQTSISISNPINGEEGVADVSFIISLDNGLLNGTGAPITGSLDYSGTATLGDDFTDVPTFSIPDGASFILLNVPVSDDLLQEPTESVIAEIASTSIGGIGVSIDTAYILDNDSTSGFDEIDFNSEKVDFYPNPASSVLHLSSNQVMKNYSILDLNGRELAIRTLNTDEAVVNIKELPKGFYIIKVALTDGNIVKRKILKE